MSITPPYPTARRNSARVSRYTSTGSSAFPFAASSSQRAHDARHTATAAIGLALIMALSIAFHISRGEKGFTINIAALLLAIFVAWGRATEWAL